MNIGQTFSNGCGTEIEPLDVFPHNRCLACHAKVFDLEQALRPTVTAESLARMWGAK